MAKDRPIRIGVDASSPEPGPGTVIEGVRALLAASASQAPPSLVLYGPREQLEQQAAELAGQVEFHDAPSVVGPEDLPHEVLRSKQDSSIVQGVSELHEGRLDAFVSMGNTGAVVGAARTGLSRVRWVQKPALGIPLPRRKGMGFLLDAGAVVDPKPGHLLQFAAMGDAFVRSIYGVPEPRIGLMNIGTEAHKGNERVRDAHKLLSRSRLNFVGNVEGGDLFGDRADVIVTDGFVGNILLKYSEAIPAMLTERLAGTGLSLVEDGPMEDFDYRRYGGAILLGVEGTVVIGHGRSSAAAVERAIRWAGKMVAGEVIEEIRNRVFQTRRAVLLANPFTRAEGSDE